MSVVYTTQDLPYQNPELPVEERAEDLLARMTLDEKLGQLQADHRHDTVLASARSGVGHVTGMMKTMGPTEAAEHNNAIQKAALETRLGIPVLVLDEALHGVWAKGSNSYPQQIGMAATWNPELMNEIAVAIAAEFESRGAHCNLSPVVNIARDARWGRTEETFGEDPYLTSRFGAAYTRGFEENGIATSPKHYAANVGDGGRDSNPVHFSERLLREIYFPGFKACVQEGGASTIMAAYNSLDGIPCTMNRWLLTDILREEWGFDGIVVTDYASGPWVMQKHFVGENFEDVATYCINAGTEVELPFVMMYGDALRAAFEKGRVSQDVLDEAVRRVLRVKLRLGLFEDRYVDPAAAPALNDTAENRKLARLAAGQSIVMLKNDGDTLPLAKDAKKIALLGPFADFASLGGYSGFGMETVSPAEGIRNAVSPDTELVVEKGTTVEFAVNGVIRETSGGTDDALPQIPLKNLIPADALPDDYGLRGEYFNNSDLSGEPVLSRVDERIDFDWSAKSPDPLMNREGFSVRWTGKVKVSSDSVYEIGLTSDDGIRFYLDGKRLIDQWNVRSATTDTVTVEMEENRSYDVRIEYKQDSGAAIMQLGMRDTKAVGDPLEVAVQAARDADLAIVFAGIVEGEKFDRSSLCLPGEQEELIARVHETGTPVVVVLVGGGAVTMQNWLHKADAVLMSWHAGQEGGNALADVLFGELSPSGKLPITFPQSVAQVPLYYNHKPSGRGYDYVDVTGDPAFAFGFGLSYTTFDYSNLQFSQTEFTENDTVKVSCDITNSGSMNADEVVQLYINDPAATLARPVKELKAFQRISLKAGETRTIEFELDRTAFTMLDIDLNEIVEPGAFEVMIGKSSADIQLKGTLTAVN